MDIQGVSYSLKIWCLLYTWLESLEIAHPRFQKFNNKYIPVGSIKIVQGCRKVDNWGGGADIHIFMFCIIYFLWKRLFLQSVNMNIWISALPIIDFPAPLKLCTRYYIVQTFHIGLLYRSTLLIIYFLFRNSFFRLRIFNIHEYTLICITFKYRYTKSKYLAGALHGILPFWIFKLLILM